jgi:hypothetical protein
VRKKSPLMRVVACYWIDTDVVGFDIDKLRGDLFQTD